MSEQFKPYTNEEMGKRWCNDERMNAIGVLIKTELNFRTLQAEITNVSGDKKLTKKDKEKRLEELKDKLAAETERLGHAKQLLKDIEGIEKEVTKLWE